MMRDDYLENKLNHRKDPIIQLRLIGMRLEVILIEIIIVVVPRLESANSGSIKREFARNTIKRKANCFDLKIAPS